jgi:CheY-like chemotaxis protein
MTDDSDLAHTAAPAMPTASMSRTLVDAMVRADGDVLKLRVGERPYVQGSTGTFEIGSRDLPAHVVYAVFEGLFPPDAKAVLMRTGRAHCVLPLQEGFPAEQFSATAVQKDVLTLEIRRRRAESARQVAAAEKPAPLVLMIDDSEDQLDLYALVLQEHYRVLLAGSGHKGIQAAQTERPDIIVCDLAMPGMDGWEVCRRLRANAATADIPIIILTATPDANLAQNAAAVGAHAFLTKPCPLDMLRVRIDDALDRVLSH